ncbi:MAG: TonB-dependent receptor plug domain-containing protein [Pseudomonadota bacterium]
MAQHLILGLMAATAQATPAADQPPAPAADAPPPVATLPAAVEGAKTYTPADFARFAPKTALDMLRQVPGFTIREQADQRGLGQATGNVLLNGERFSGKSNDVVTELGRISAANVTRIEIVDGATLDVPGLSGQVANIVSVSGGISGSFAYRPEIRARRLPALLTRGEVSVNGKIAGADYTVSLGNDSRRNGNNGPEVVFLPNGTITDRRAEDLRISTESPKLSGRLHHVNDSGAVWNLNGSAQYFRQDLAEISLRTGPGLVDRDRRLKERLEQPSYELGGDYEFGVFGGKLKFIGLRRANTTDYTQLLTVDFANMAPSSGDRYVQDASEQETIARSEFRWKGGKADWQISLEGAYNALDVSNALFSADAAGVFQPIPFPGSESKVEEKRAEAILSYGRPLSRTLTLQASLGAEYSELSQSGPNGLTRNFVRPKGSASLAWKPSPKLDLSLKVERVVGQLNFFDFVASGNISAGTTNAGNANLVPPQAWNIDLAATRNLGAWGTVNARGYVRFISDIVDVIPIGATGQAPGNLDSAVRYGTQITGTLNLDPLGFKGAKIDADLIFQRSRLTDPLTGIRREISEQTTRFVNVNFRHDIPKTAWAYGASYEDFRQAYGYRLDQRFLSRNSPGGVGIFVENKDVLGLTVRGSLYGLLNTNESFEREFYNGRRTNGLAFTESRDRYYGLIFGLSITGKF